jgi:hypothetical protein
MASAKASQTNEENTKRLNVDWIILTAAFFGLTVVSLASIQAGSDGLAAHMGSYIVSSSLE